MYDIIIHLVYSEGLMLLLLPETQPLVDGGVILPYYYCSHYYKSRCSVSAHFCNHMHESGCIKLKQPTVIHLFLLTSSGAFIPPVIIIIMHVHTYTRVPHTTILFEISLAPLGLEIIYTINFGKIIILQVFSSTVSRLQ